MIDKEVHKNELLNVIVSAIKYMFTKEIVTTVAFVLAVVSAFFAPPDNKYAGYIDYSTLGLLLTLMCIMGGMRRLGVFSKLAERLLLKVSGIKSISLVFILLCFFTSMFITNDVSLITFVPFAIEVLDMSGLNMYTIKLVTLQTVAANLGSMVMPMGNPQNLFLYSTSEMKISEFIKIMMPYAFVSLVLLIVCVFLFMGKEKTQLKYVRKNKINTTDTIMYIVLFLICLLAILKILPIYISLIITLLYVIIFDRSTIKTPDYFLLLTFVFLFVFIGNIGRIDVIRHFLETVVTGHEKIVTFISSQFMSNVPAAILLSGFTTKYKEILIGSNIGGLGTIIASMASLISFKLYVASEESDKASYLLWFTGINILFAVVLFGIALLLREV